MGNAKNRRPQNSKQAKSGNWSKKAKSNTFKGAVESKKPKYKGKWD